MAATLLVVVASCGGGDDSSERPTHASPRERLGAVESGVVFDSGTGLEWTSRDDDQALAWESAERHCRELALAGRTDWRLPEIAELQALYDKRFAEPCGDRTCHLDPRIHLASPYVWSGTARGPGTRFYFDFSLATSLSPGIAPTLVRRVLCVRPRAP
jgi:hypothetical protein